MGGDLEDLGSSRGGGGLFGEPAEVAGVSGGEEEGPESADEAELAAAAAALRLQDSPEPPEPAAAPRLKGKKAKEARKKARAEQQQQQQQVSGSVSRPDSAGRVLWRWSESCDNVDLRGTVLSGGVLTGLVYSRIDFYHEITFHLVVLKARSECNSVLPIP